MRRVKVLVDGKVQRVGYRYLVASIARKYKVKGYIKNLEDGRVEIVAEGEDLDAFLREIEIKNHLIFVESVEKKEEKPTGEFKTFKIIVGKIEEELVEGFGTGATYLMKIMELQQKTINLQERTIGLQEKTINLQEKTIELQQKTIGLQEKTINLQEKTISLQEETLNEIRALRQDIRVLLDERLKKLEEDVAKIKVKLGIS
ncbi:Acylphosphatase [archaeon HR06]|nr:Acylphosphatase [archaeon HR06]